MKETPNITTEDIHNALMARYTEPEWYLGFEVANSCGSEVVLKGPEEVRGYVPIRQ